MLFCPPELFVLTVTCARCIGVPFYFSCILERFDLKKNFYHKQDQGTQHRVEKIYFFLLSNGSSQVH